MTDLRHSGRADRATEFVAAAVRVHGSRYTYDDAAVQFRNQKSPVSIGCRVHGTAFQQAPRDHIRGQGCPDCGGRRGSTKASRAAMFERKAQAKHRNKYRYDLSSYVDSRSGVRIFCNAPGHGWFSQRATNHLQGQQCPDCADLLRRTNWAAGRLGRRARAAD